MRRVYVAGPMRGIPELNFPAFFAAEERLRAAGFEVLNPARIDTELDGAEAKGTKSIAHYVRRDIDAILSLGSDGAIAVLPGWERSTGAYAEVCVARWLQLEILDADTLNPLGASER